MMPNIFGIDLGDDFPWINVAGLQPEDIRGNSLGEY